MFRNQPSLRSNDGEHKIKRYVHSPLTVEHQGINAGITANGKIVLSKVAKVTGDDVEYDEIEIPASLIFKLASLLKATRRIEYVAIGQLAAVANTSAPVDDENS